MKPTARASDTAREPQDDTPPTSVTDTAVTTPDDAGMDTDVSEGVSQSQPIADGGGRSTHPRRFSGSATRDSGTAYVWTYVAFDAGPCPCDEGEYRCLRACNAAHPSARSVGPFFRDNIAKAQMLQGSRMARSCLASLSATAPVSASVSVEFSNTGTAVTVTIKKLQGAERGSAASTCIEAAFQQIRIPAFVGGWETMENWPFS